MNFAIGDWVSGHTSQGELVRGFIDSMQIEQGTVSLLVTESDHEAAVGKLLTLQNRAVRTLPAFAADDESSILNFIDMALTTKDEAWFRELSEQLLAVRNKGVQVRERIGAPSGIRNRLLFH
ncbi:MULTISPECIES: IDEAL domain-containing protein [Cohnella]|uniref:IDEAL domain-containing protein n=1 Tax=Cohnella TaxID=329857 RepID=UPI0009BBDA65|nr:MULTISPECIES: IDEAL domain-containing protein [Cohnella]MBN2983760.1 IDEAL domain-containing protein [Cohnella algarum]